LGIVLNLLTGYLGWFLRSGVQSVWSNLFLILNFSLVKILNLLEAWTVILYVLMSTSLYAVVTYREIRVNRLAAKTF